MKVLLLNGSPRQKGCTQRALKEIEIELNAQGIDTEYIQVGDKAISGCMACGVCKHTGKCAIDDLVNELAVKFCDADGMVLGTPVYYAGANGTLLSLLDRLFCSTPFDKTMKVGATVLSSRRAGSTSAMDELNKYFAIANMPIVPSTYWNEVHGSTAQEVEKDLEGLQTMRNIAKNMAFMLKSFELGKDKYGLPNIERGARTNFADGK